MLAIPLDATTAGKVLAISGSAYAVLQALKKVFPGISGYWAVALNVAINVIGVLIVLPPEKLFSLESLTTLLIAGITAAGSAGIHGTVQNVAPAAVQSVLGQKPVA